MPEKKNTQNGLTRRSFLKTSGAIAGAAGLGASVMFTTENWLAPRKAEAQTDETVNEETRYTFHPINCGGRCSHKCTVRDGRLVQIQPNEWSEDRFSTICLRGISEMQRIYSSDRIQTPLKRIGERGSYDFESISWDEALSTIADKLKASKEQYGGESILFSYSSGVPYTMNYLRQFLGAQSVCESGIDMMQGNGLDICTGNYVVGITLHEMADWVNSKVIMFVASNPLETALTSAQYLLDAKEAGAEVIVIDPVYSSTASKADIWQSIRAGTDGALFLAMITEIIDNEWYNVDFMKKSTMFPCLVSTADGSLIRKVVGVNEEDGSDITEYVVWDRTTNSPVSPLDETADPYLIGHFNYEGTEVTTVFDLLMENQKQYSSEWAAEVTDIPADAIKTIAEKYALSGGSYLGLGFSGPDKFSNGDIVGHAAGVLAALTGNIGIPGGGVGVTYSYMGCWSALAALGSWSIPEEFVETPLEMQTPLLRTEPNSVKIVFNVGNSLLQHLNDSKLTKQWLETMDLVVTIDPYFCDSARYSDIVLPTTSCYENAEEVGHLELARNHALLQLKVLDPLFESKTDFEVDKALCEMLGYGEYFPPSMEELAKAKLNTADPFLKGISVQSLKDHNGVQRMNVPDGFLIPHAGGTFGTPSGRMEIYHDHMIEYNQQLPTYEPPSEAYEGNPLMDKYPLQFNQTRTRYHVHSQFQRAAWIRELVDTATAEISPAEAEKRGIENGDRVRIFNDRGSIEANIRVSVGVRDAHVSFSEGVWEQDTGGNSFQDIVNGNMPERGKALVYGANIPFNDTLVEIEKI